MSEIFEKNLQEILDAEQYYIKESMSGIQIITLDIDYPENK